MNEVFKTALLLLFFTLLTVFITQFQMHFKDRIFIPMIVKADSVQAAWQPENKQTFKFNDSTLIHSDEKKYKSLVTASPGVISLGDRISVDVTVNSSIGEKLVVDIEVYDPNENKVFQKVYENQAFYPMESKNFKTDFTASSDILTGIYTVRLGIFDSTGMNLLYWDNVAASFDVVTYSADITNPVSFY